MENAKRRLFEKNLLPLSHLLLLFPLLLFFFILNGCASSTVSRDAATSVDFGVQNARNLVEGGAGGNIADSYQNSSQRTKGLILGGAAGAVVGGLSSSLVGMLPGAAIGAVLGGSYGTYIDTHTSIADQLINRGATIIVLGDQVLLVLPSARIFYGMTPRIKPSAYMTLRLAVAYINRYTKMLVKVSAHTNALGSKAIDMTLSQLQAESVANFLFNSGINTRILYAEGYGGTHLVERNTTSPEGGDNYRIEITFEKLYV